MSRTFRASERENNSRYNKRVKFTIRNSNRSKKNADKYSYERSCEEALAEKA